jgi:hypothetical protein
LLLERDLDLELELFDRDLDREREGDLENLLRFADRARDVLRERRDLLRFMPLRIGDLERDLDLNLRPPRGTTRRRTSTSTTTTSESSARRRTITSSIDWHRR